MTPERTKEIHRALEASNGSFPDAAKSLGISLSRLYQIVNKTKSLKLQWGRQSTKASKSLEAQEIHRQLPDSLGNAPLDIVDAVTSEDAAMKHGLIKMGVRGAAAEQALFLQKYQKKQFASAIEIVGAGAVKLYLNMLASIDDIEKELESGVSDKFREIALRNHHVSLIKESSKIFDSIHKSEHLKAMIKHMQKSGRGGSRRPKGFLALKAEPGSNVTVSMNGDNDDEESTDTD